MGILNGKRIALLVSDGTPREELRFIREELATAGAKTDLVSTTTDPLRPPDGQGAGRQTTGAFRAHAANTVTTRAYHGLVIPGGAAANERLRIDRQIMGFIRSFAAGRKPIAAKGCGLVPLLDLGLLHGRMVAANVPLRDQLLEGGAIVEMNDEIVVDCRLVTGGPTAELAGFTNAMIEVFASQEAAVSA